MRALLSRIKSIGFLLALFAWSASFGGQWIAPRLAIWTLMVVDYSRTTTLGKAIEETVSGEYPCERCHRLSLAQQAEQSQSQNPVALDALKVTPCLDTAHASLLPFPTLLSQFEKLLINQKPRSFLIQPPTPPPRSISA